MTVYPICRRLSSTFSKLAQRNVHILLPKKPDHQPVWKTDDLRTVATVAPLHTVVVGAGGFRDRDLTALYGDGVAAAVGSGNGEALVNGQVYGFDCTAIAEHLRELSAFPWTQKESAEQNAPQKQ